MNIVNKDPVLTQVPKSLVAEAINELIALKNLPKNIRYDVECIIGWDDCVHEMIAYTIDPALPRTVDRYTTLYLNMLLKGSYQGRGTISQSRLLDFLRRECRVPYFNINMT